jgi:hypothetical protein
VFAEGLRRTLLELQAAGARVWLIKQVPVQRRGSFGRTVKPLKAGVTDQEYEEQQSAVDEVLRSQSWPGLNVIGPSANWFDQDGHSLVADGRVPFYRDPDHLTPLGAERLMRPLLEPVFNAMR